MNLKKQHPLHNCSILVTRPEHQAEPFCQLLEQAGASVFRFPVIEIKAAKLDQQTFSTPDQQDIILFTSSNAVQFSLPWLKPFIHPQSHSLPCKVGVIGKKTALMLEKHHIKVDLQPLDSFNSESLLALPAMQQVDNKNILIIKGEGGRTLLSDTLQSRGAKVQSANTYMRQRPIPDNQKLQALRSKKIDIITLTSAESSDNLFSILQDQDMTWLTRATLLLGSARIQQSINKNEINNKRINNPCWVAENPADDAMYSALINWKQQHIEQFQP